MQSVLLPVFAGSESRKFLKINQLYPDYNQISAIWQSIKTIINTALDFIKYFCC